MKRTQRQRMLFVGGPFDGAVELKPVGESTTSVGETTRETPGTLTNTLIKHVYTMTTERGKPKGSWNYTAQIARYVRSLPEEPGEPRSSAMLG